jgi:2-polyprenyl-6-hydroxyphenyl methylase/3-demethylubiquinone-9 3-methyltransferase
MEVIEHIYNKKKFIKNIIDLLKPGGICFFSTINKTYFSYIKNIIFGEYILNMIPKKTHQYKLFINPHQLCNILRKNNCTPYMCLGIRYDFFKKEFYLSKKLPINNYIIYFKKNNYY